MTMKLPAVPRLLGVCLLLVVPLTQRGIETAAAPPLRLRSKDATKRASVDSKVPEDQTGYFFFAEELDPNWVPPDESELSEKLKKFEDNYDAVLKDRLRGMTDYHVASLTLRHLFSRVATETQIGVYVDPAVLEEVGTGIDVDLGYMHVDGVRWSSILTLALDPLHLEWTIEDQILSIQRRQDPPPRPKIRREYAIGDIAWRYKNGSREFDPDGILNEIWRKASFYDVEYGAIVSVRATGPVFVTSKEKKGSVIFRLPPQGHEALATGLAKFRALKRSLPDSDDVDFPQLLRVQRWKEGYFPRERFRPEILALLIRSIDSPEEKRRLARDWPSIAVFGDGKSAIEHVRALPEKQLRGGIVVLESDRQTRTTSDEPSNEMTIQDVLAAFCRKRNIDLFEQVTVTERHFVETRYRRVVKSTDSIYPDAP